MAALSHDPDVPITVHGGWSNLALTSTKLNSESGAMVRYELYRQDSVNDPREIKLVFEVDPSGRIINAPSFEEISQNGMGLRSMIAELPEQRRLLLDQTVRRIVPEALDIDQNTRLFHRAPSEGITGYISNEQISLHYDTNGRILEMKLGYYSTINPKEYVACIEYNRKTIEGLLTHVSEGERTILQGILEKFRPELASQLGIQTLGAYYEPAVRASYNPRFETRVTVDGTEGAYSLQPTNGSLSAFALGCSNLTAASGVVDHGRLAVQGTLAHTFADHKPAEVVSIEILAEKPRENGTVRVVTEDIALSLTLAPVQVSLPHFFDCSVPDILQPAEGYVTPSPLPEEILNRLVRESRIQLSVSVGEEPFRPIPVLSQAYEEQGTLTFTLENTFGCVKAMSFTHEENSPTTLASMARRSDGSLVCRETLREPVDQWCVIEVVVPPLSNSSGRLSFLEPGNAELLSVTADYQLDEQEDLVLKLTFEDGRSVRAEAVRKGERYAWGNVWVGSPSGIAEEISGGDFKDSYRAHLRALALQLDSNNKHHRIISGILSPHNSSGVELNAVDFNGADLIRWPDRFGNADAESSAIARLRESGLQGELVSESKYYTPDFYSGNSISDMERQSRELEMMRSWDLINNLGYRVATDAYFNAVSGGLLPGGALFREPQLGAVEFIDCVIRNGTLRALDSFSTWAQRDEDIYRLTIDNGVYQAPCLYCTPHDGILNTVYSALLLVIDADPQTLRIGRIEIKNKTSGEFEQITQIPELPDHEEVRRALISTLEANKWVQQGGAFARIGSLRQAGEPFALSAFRWAQSQQAVYMIPTDQFNQKIIN